MWPRAPYLAASLSIAFAIALAGCETTARRGPGDRAAKLSTVDPYTLAGKKHLLRDYPPFSASGNVNVVVEIPAGTNAKWEVDKSTGHLKWEFEEGKPRVVAYLACPGNYGMIPGTLLPKVLGGDGDPLDVIILGPAVSRGSIVSARPIGVLRMRDGGEKDDKIIAVLLDSPLGEVGSMGELTRRFNGVADILEIWFSNYKGPGKIRAEGFGSVTEARDLIEAAAGAYRRAPTPAR